MTKNTRVQGPTELNDDATDKVDGGIIKFTDLLVSSVKDAPKKKAPSSFTADSFSFGVERE